MQTELHLYLSVVTLSKRNKGSEDEKKNRSVLNREN